jgi:hypothetical protein
VIEILPSQAAERLRALRQRAKDAHAIVPEFESIREASAAKTNAASGLKRLLAPASEGGFRLAAGDQRVIAATKVLEKAEDEFRRVQERQAARSAAWQTSSAALANVQNWLRDGRPSGTTLEAVEVDVPKPVKGESGLFDQIENRRRRVRELKAAQHTIESAPFPSSFAKQRMREMVEQLAQRGAPSASSLIEHDDEIIWPMVQVQVQVFNAQPEAIDFAEVPDMLAIDAWRNRDALIAALDREIVAEADDKAALSHTDRELRTSETMSDLLAVERTEAALVWSAQAQSLPVEHRGDISPQALLGVALVTAPRAIDGPTTSPFAYDVVGGGGRRR